jgi:hypothetical protein
MNLWERNFREMVISLSNADLFEEFVDSFNSDDWDGGFTKRRAKENEILAEEVRKRLGVWLAQ